MKLLLDQNLSRRILRELDPAFEQSSHVQLLGLEQADDLTIWQFAGRNGFVIVTLDADFNHLSALHGPPPHVVWLRCGNVSRTAVTRLLNAHIEEIQALIAASEHAVLEVHG